MLSWWCRTRLTTSYAAASTSYVHFGHSHSTPSICTLVHAFISSPANYWNFKRRSGRRCFGCCSTSASGTTCCSTAHHRRPMEHITPILRDILHWLPMWITFKITFMAFNSISGTRPVTSWTSVFHFTRLWGTPCTALLPMATWKSDLEVSVYPYPPLEIIWLISWEISSQLHDQCTLRCVIAALGMPMNDKNRRSVSHQYIDAGRVHGSQWSAAGRHSTEKKVWHQGRNPWGTPHTMEQGDEEVDRLIDCFTAHQHI